MRKLNAECFLKVIQDHHLNAHETLFIDDTIQHVKGARKVGINAILLKKEVTIMKHLPGIIQLEPHS